jgi:hypothetical protein
MKKIIVKTGNKKITLPAGLMYIKYLQGKKIVSALKLDINDKFLEQIFLIAAVLDIKTKEIATADPDKVDVLYKICTAILGHCDIPVYNIIKSGNRWFKMKDLNKLTVDDYFQIDKIYKEYQDDILTAGVEIIKQLYIPVKAPILFKYKNYGGFKCLSSPNDKRFKINTEDKQEEINEQELPTGFISSIYYYIIEYKKNIMIKYPIIFEQPDDEQEEQQEEDYDETKKFGYTQSITEIWGWYDIISSTCNNNKLEIDYWMTRPCEEFLTFMCYQVQKNKAEQKTKIN